MSKIIGIFVFFSIISCNKIEKFDLPENQEKVITMNSLSGDYDSITNRVKNFGDKEAYSELFYSFKDSNFGERTDSLMIYSKIMAEKFNYENAYIDYLDAITEKYDVEKNIGDYGTINLTNLKISEKKQILNWLNIMLEKKIITQNEYDAVKK